MLLPQFCHCRRSVEEDWNLFKDTLQQSIDKNIPSKLVSGKDKLPWMTPHLRRLIRRKNKLHARLQKTGSGRLRALCIWRTARKGLSAALRIARNEYVNNAVRDIKSNPKPFWKFIRSQRKDNQAMPPLKTPSDHLAESDLEKRKR